MSKAIEKRMVLTKEGNEMHIDANLEGQELVEALVACIGYVGAHLQNPEQISYVCGIACGDAIRLMKEKDIIQK